MIYGRKGDRESISGLFGIAWRDFFKEMVSFHWKPDFRKPHEVRLGCQELEQHYFLVKIKIFEKTISSMGKKTRCLAFLHIIHDKFRRKFHPYHPLAYVVAQGLTRLADFLRLIQGETGCGKTTQATTARGWGRLVSMYKNLYSHGETYDKSIKGIYSWVVATQIFCYFHP